MYRIRIEQKAVREIESLQREMLSRIMRSISLLKDNPRPIGIKKLVVKDGWRIRVGDYRILYTIDDRQKLVTIYRIKHRREVYR